MLRLPAPPLSVVFRGKKPLSLFNLNPEIDQEAVLGRKPIFLTDATLFTKWQSSFTQLKSYLLRSERYPVAIDVL